MPLSPLPNAALLLLAAVVSVGCDRQRKTPAPTDAAAPSAKPDLVAAADDDDSSAARPQKRGNASQAGERVKLPGGRFVAGSTPGDRGRDPSYEPALLEVELTPFEIDRLPQPNDPAKPAHTGVTRDAAAATCGEHGGRLCTELEWEYACKGPDDQRYAGGDVWDGSCATKPQTCASGFGVLAMGGAVREWTASEVSPIKEYRSSTGAAVRGAASDAADVDHRCAHRASVDPASSGTELGFRCCYGPANEAAVPSPSWLATMRKADMPADKLAKLFAADPRLASLAKSIKYFREENAVATVLRRGRANSEADDAGALPPETRMTTAPSIWNPAPGEEILLVTGQSGKDSFIVAFHRLPGGRHRVGAAMTLKDELGPVVLAYNPYVRRKLEWTICWQCRAETGFITYRSDNRVVITQD